MGKSVFFLFIIVLIFLYSCSKSGSCKATKSVAKAPAGEVSSLSDSLEKYGIHDVIQSPDGFFYKINTPGDGASTTDLCSTISIRYWGGFFNGQSFDVQNQPVSFMLGQLIGGFQKAIPLIKVGGDIDLYIPPSLGYEQKAVTGKTEDGLSDSILIPANSYLVFKHVQLTEVQ